MIKKIVRVLCAPVVVYMCVCLASCKTVPTSVPEEITEAELFQLGQSAMDNSNYKAAEFYYGKVIELYGSNIAASVAAEYELAHIQVKRKNYKAAEPALARIISYYDDLQTAAMLPPAYKKLALIDLEKCRSRHEKAKKPLRFFV